MNDTHRKSDSPSITSYQLVIALQLGAGPLERLTYACWNFSLSWWCTGLVHTSTVAVNLCVQQSCPVPKTAFHTPHHSWAFTLFLRLLLWWSLSLELWRADLAVTLLSKHSSLLILSTVNNSEFVVIASRILTKAKSSEQLLNRCCLIIFQTTCFRKKI